MTVRRRIVLAVLIGLASGACCYYYRIGQKTLASDFTWPLRAARALLAGENPYQLIQATGGYPFDAPFYYPLPTALVAIPFAPFQPPVAAALFFGLSGFLLALAASKDGWRRMPVFVSVPFWYSAMVAQWSPLMLAAALLPFPARALAICKPNLGIAAFVYRPCRRSLIVMAGALALSLLILPSWPLGCVAALRQAPPGKHIPPILVFPGVFLLLAALRWRTPEGRLLLSLALLPHHPYWYDALLLWLIPRDTKQGALLSLYSWFALVGWIWRSPPATSHLAMLRSVWPWSISLIYLPALLMVLTAPLTAAELAVWQRWRARLVRRAGSNPQS